MAYEQFANGGISSLAAGINDTVGSLTVKSAVGFPTVGNFRIIVGTRDHVGHGRAGQNLHGHARGRSDVGRSSQCR